MIAFGIFEGFGWISGKIEEIRKIWAISGVLRHDVGTPHRSGGPRQDVACPCHVLAWPSGRLVKPRVRHCIDTVHSMEIVVFCFM